MNTLKTVSLTIASLLAISCVKQTGAPSARGNTSKITSVKMRVPTQIGKTDITGKISGYTLQVKKTGGTCVFSDIDRTSVVASGDVKIDASLKQDCDYELLLSFGKISADSLKLDKVYLTSDAHDGRSALPAIVKQADLKGKTEVTIKACVSVTAAGAQELSVSAAECPSVTDNSINSNIEPVIPQPSAVSSNLKLSKITSATAEGSEVSLSGEVISSSPSTKYCSLAINAFYGTPTPKLVLFDENFIEFKAGAKVSLDKNISFDAGPQNGPLVFTELQVLEQCFDAKPATTVKPADLFSKCVADKSCPVVRP